LSIEFCNKFFGLFYEILASNKQWSPLVEVSGLHIKDIHEANAHLVEWVAAVAGTRVHGTTQERPLMRFEKERAHLRALPANRYEVVTWKQVKLHPDCHVVFDYGYYSAPHRLVGEKLWIKATPHRVEV